MTTIYLQTYSWITEALGMRGKNAYTFVKKVEAGTTLLTLFSELSRDNPEFKKRVFNWEIGILSDQVLLLVNDRLARFDQVSESPLKAKDSISLVPVIIGG